MKNDLNLLLAGFGGQGVLFAGKVAAYCGLIEDRQLSWLPSYGPEMKGGTANCGVRISNTPIGSPLVDEPEQLIAMNQPSFDKFVNAVPGGGLIIADSSLISSKVERSDVTVYYIPSTELAEDAGLKGLSNIVLIGKLFAVYPFCKADTLTEAIRKSTPASKKELFEFNIKAAKLGMEYK